jgi:hypothetical protein
MIAGSAVFVLSALNNTGRTAELEAETTRARALFFKRARLMGSAIPRTVQLMENKSTEHNGLHEEMRNIIEEARVILPGVQALFGFQTIAVFNDRFVELPLFAKDCHLVGLGMVIIAVALVMTPAIYYRIVGPSNVSRHMVKVSSRLIRCALAPLACGLALDMFTVIFMATRELPASLVGALATFVFLTGLWFVFPMNARRNIGKLKA